MTENEKLDAVLVPKNLPWNCPNCNNTHRGKKNERPLYRDTVTAAGQVIRICYLCHSEIPLKEFSDAILREEHK